VLRDCPVVQSHPGSVPGQAKMNGFVPEGHAAPPNDASILVIGNSSLKS